LPSLRARGAAARANAIPHRRLCGARACFLPQSGRDYAAKRCLVLGVARYQLRHWRRRVQCRAVLRLRPLDAPRRRAAVSPRAHIDPARARVCHSRPRAVSRGWIALISLLAAAVTATAVLVAFTARGAAPAPAAVSLEP